MSKSHFKPTIYKSIVFFLVENALKALTIDVIEQLQKAAEIIGSDESSKDEKLDALETILNYTDDIDTAIDFCKIGGLYILDPCLSSPHPQIRSRAALLIAELAQNNPYCQKALLDADILPKLMTLLSETETAPDGLRAVSCLVRSYEPCLTAFIEIGGLECLLGCLQQIDQEKLLTRAMFLLNSLCSDFPEIRDELVKLKIIDLMVPIIQAKSEYNILLETSLSTLCLFMENSDAIARCHSPETNLKSQLEDVIQVAGDKPECKEIIEYSQSILKRLNSSKPDIEATDR